MAEKRSLLSQKLILDMEMLIKFGIEWWQLLKRHVELLLNMICY